MRALVSSCLLYVGLLAGSEIVTNPFVGITLITRTETVPRSETIHIARIDLNATGLGFKLTSPGGTMETVRKQPSTI